MQKSIKCPIRVRPSVYICLSVLLLLIPVRWLFAWVIAAAFHELCHYCVLTLFHRRVLGLQIGIGGAIMETDELGKTEEFISSLAGPAGGLILLMFAKWFPRLAICGWCQSVYNLIPIYPLDGGRALRCILRHFLEDPLANKVSAVIEDILLCLFAMFGIYLWTSLNLGPIPLIFVFMIAVKTRKIKFPCNERRQRVQ